MNWRDQLQTASFRGVSFFIKNNSTSPGRRLIVNMLPGRNEPEIQNLGRRARRFTIEGYVIGDDFIDQINRLISACEREEPGEYIDSFYGRKSVVCDQFTPEFNNLEGRVARFSIVFVEAIEQPGISIKTNTQAQVQADAATGKKIVFEKFESDYNIGNKPQFIVDKATAAVKSAISFITQNKRSASSLTDFQWQINRTASNFIETLLSPTDLAVALTNLISIDDALYSIKNRLIDGIKLFDLYTTSYDTEKNSPDPDPNVIAITQLIRSASIIDAAIASSMIVYDTYDDAMSYRQTLLQSFETLMTTADDELYEQLHRLRASVARDISVRSFDAPRIMPYALAMTYPAIVLAYQLYGDVTRADEIVNRNHIVHPGFVPGGVPLEVLAK